MVGKQFSVSVINLATSIGTIRRNSAIATINEPTVEQRKHALSEENLPSMVCLLIEKFCFYFVNIYNLRFNLLLYESLFICKWMFIRKDRLQIYIRVDRKNLIKSKKDLN